MAWRETVVSWIRFCACVLPFLVYGSGSIDDEISEKFSRQQSQWRTMALTLFSKWR